MSRRAPVEKVRQSASPRTRRLGAARWWLPVVLASGGLAVATSPAQALPLTITVTVNSVVEPELANIDSTSDADFYGRTYIDGEETRFGVFAEDDSFIEPNWTATKTVDHTADFATVTIQVYDEDSGLNFDDNMLDIDSGIDQYDNPRSIDLTIALHVPDADCGISRDVFGKCNQRLTSFGNDGSDYAEVQFTVTVSEPGQVPGLHVGCSHTPLWPQPGAAVTFTASSFGDQVDGQALPAKLSDQLEIWYSTDGGATKTVAASGATQTTFTTIRNAGAAGTTLSYGCRLVDDGVPIYSGWRSVQVGDPPAGRAVPVLLSASRERALDIVLFPVTQNVRRAPFSPTDTALLGFPVYTGANDAAFLTAAEASVAELMREQLVLDNQRRLNVWIARDGGATGGTRDLLLDADSDGQSDDPAPDTTGDGLPDGDGNVDVCQHQPPPNMGRDYGFANVRAFVHPATPPPGDVNTLRECASGGVFSSEASEAGVFIHETGHSGWGLADEYCCDGGYRVPAINPNIYGSLAACTSDVGSLGGVASDCRGFDSNDTGTAPDVWVSDPATADLMVDNTFARRADRRRIAYVFGLAAAGQL